MSEGGIDRRTCPTCQRVWEAPSCTSALTCPGCRESRGGRDAMTFDQWFRVSFGPFPTEADRDAAIRGWLAALRLVPPDRQFAAWLYPYWQGCGPWVSPADLDETGRAIRSAFVALFDDPRVTAWLRETGRV